MEKTYLILLLLIHPPTIIQWEMRCGISKVDLDYSTSPFPYDPTFAQLSTDHVYLILQPLLIRSEQRKTTPP